MSRFKFEKGKQAVVIIHGVGEQVPMDTLRAFVDTVWTADSSVCDPKHAKEFNRTPKSWSKPDEISGDFELRRITTNYNKNDVRTDFFEFYWAHLMSETKIAQVWAWARVLLLRKPSRVPKQLRPVWLLLVVLGLLVLSGALFLALPHEIATDLLGWSKLRIAVVNGLLVGLWTAIAWFLIYHAGDAARYLHVRPPNIEVRHAIRTAGVDLLDKLHKAKKYDRIVIVGHSLGTVIGYDILSYFWQSCHTKLHLSKQPKQEELEELEDLARQHESMQEEYRRLLRNRADSTSSSQPKQDGQEKILRTLLESKAREYRDKQPEYFNELRGQQCPWLVTDFVTLGSPLAHAEVLLARNRAQLEKKEEDRELPACPPFLEDTNNFSFPNEDVKGKCPHHAALFAPARWTNIYFPSKWAIFGDPIGGPWRRSSARA